MNTLIEAGETAYPSIFELLTPPELDALALAAAVHDDRDREQWGGIHYWDQLTERCKLARIAGPNLADWWGDIAQRMGVSLRRSNRASVTEILNRDDPAVLDHLVDQTDYLIGCLLRLCTEARRTSTIEANEAQELPL